MSIPMQLALGLSFGALMITLEWRMLRSGWWRRWGNRSVTDLLRRTPYSPLYAEKKCALCGRWRGEHIGCSSRDDEMACPTLIRWNTFVPLPGSDESRSGVDWDILRGILARPQSRGTNGMICSKGKDCDCPDVRECGNAEPAESHLPLTLGEWNTDEQGRTLSGPGVCSTCDGGGCRDCIG
jgi:hypothetical protein